MPLLASALLLLAAQVTIPVSGKPDRLHAADMNKDGHLDLIVGCDHALVVLLNDGKSGFREMARVAVGAQPTELAVADFTGDGKPDVAFADHDTFATILLAGDGRGGLQRLGLTRAMRTGRPHTHGLLAGDWNRDGKADLAHFSVDEHAVVVLTGDGRGELSPGTPLPVNAPNNPIAVDVNNDGSADLVVPNTGSNKVSVLLGNSQGGFQAAPGSPYGVADRPYYAAVGDVNSDKHLDVLVTHDDRDELTVLVGDGKGHFQASPEGPVRLGGRAYSILVADVNQDGRLDIVATSDTQIYTVLQRRNGTLAPAQTQPKPKGHWRLITADWNGDGKPDFASSSPDANEVHILFGPLRE